MRLSSFLTTGQVADLHRSALQVLAEVGVRVEHASLRDGLAALGAVAGDDERVRFGREAVERELAESPREAPFDGPPHVSMSSWVYESVYLDPSTGETRRFDEPLLARYLALARALVGPDAVGLLGVPFLPSGLPPRLLPLAEKVTAWKWGAHPGGSVHFTGLCPALLDLFECHARYSGRGVRDVFVGGGYLISPLRLARPECEQLLWFHERGLRFFLGHLPIQGGTAPVTFAGAIVQSLAEQLFLHLVRRSLWPDAALALFGSVSTMDMRSGVSCYGRPEQQRINAAFAELARFYRCATGGHTGLTDAKRPGCEAGAQKAAGALWTALTCGSANLEAGMLSMDEVCSPVQMVLDRDIVLGLRALLAERPVDEAACAVDEIAAVSRGGTFVGTDLTAARHRAELYSPATWSYEFLGRWEAGGGRLDVDRARAIALDGLAGAEPEPCITQEEEADLRAIIADAARLAP